MLVLSTLDVDHFVTSRGTSFGSQPFHHGSALGCDLKECAFLRLFVRVSGTLTLCIRLEVKDLIYSI